MSVLGGDGLERGKKIFNASPVMMRCPSCGSDQTKKTIDSEGGRFAKADGWECDACDDVWTTDPKSGQVHKNAKIPAHPPGDCAYPAPADCDWCGEAVCAGCGNVGILNIHTACEKKMAADTKRSLKTNDVMRTAGLARGRAMFKNKRQFDAKKLAELRPCPSCGEDVRLVDTTTGLCKPCFDKDVEVEEIP